MAAASVATIQTRAKNAPGSPISLLRMGFSFARNAAHLTPGGAVVSRMRQWVDAKAVAFLAETGPNAGASVAFKITGGAQWGSEAKTARRSVPGSNVEYVQYLGRGSESVDYELKLASIEEFHTLKALMGATGTLTIAADVAALTDRASAVIGGERYDRLGDVTLLSIDPSSAQYFPGGVCSCTATFLRAASDAIERPLWIGGA